MPVGAFGGRADLMDQMSPQGPVYQAGTLSGNPLAVAAGLKTLEILAKNKLSDKFAASPAIANGRIYLRGFEHLYAIGAK